jgi:hypothetical protein
MHELKNILLLDENSPKKAFYRIFLLETEEGYLIRKESGAANKVLDCRTWSKPSLVEADKFYSSIIRRKTNPARKSPRHYLISQLQ